MSALPVFLTSVKAFLVRMGMCMVSTEHDSKGTLPSYFSLGWGDTGVQETSTDKLQETVVPIVESSNCIERVNQTRGVNKDLIVCAGGASEGPCKVFKGNQNMIGITLKPRVTVVGHLQ